MAWKIFNIETGELVKGGFDDEDSAKAWLENRFGESADLDAYDINEMDDDEEADYDGHEDEYSGPELGENEVEEADSDDDDDEEDMTDGLTEVDDLDY
jgi:hypothetical protein